MPRTIELTPTTVEGTTSVGFAVSATSPVVVGIYVASGEIPRNALLQVMIETPGLPVAVHNLHRGDPVRQLVGPVSKYQLRLIENGGGVVGGYKDVT